MTDRHAEAVGGVHTKIVATIGPASRSPERIEALIRAGVDVFRLNFSHGVHDDHSSTYHHLRGGAETLDRSVAILMDLCGPKIRLGPIPGDVVECPIDAEFNLVTERTGDDPRELTCTFRELPHDLQIGQTILMSDGNVSMKVLDTSADRATLRVVQPGHLRSNQGINLPDSTLRLPSLTEKDVADLDWAKDHPVEFVALSFVRTADDLHGLRRHLGQRSIKAQIVAKIEKPEAVKNLHAILAATNAVMVARGDLGVEMDVVRVPAVQKRVIDACRSAGVPVITATEMLASMEHSPRPTRAETSDVYNAVLDGTDAVMLSAETAIGAYPVEAVRTMSRVVRSAETEGTIRPVGEVAGRPRLVTPITRAIVEAASHVCRRLNPALIVVETLGGTTAAAISNLRLPTPIVALSSDPVCVRRMSLLWGVSPLHVEDLSDETAVLRRALRWAAEHGLVKGGDGMMPGDHVVTLIGTLPDRSPHNALRIHEVTAADLA